MGVEGTVGLGSPGQYEVTLRPDDLLIACDHLTILREAVKDIAADEGGSATFMAAYSDGIGCACHLSLSLRGIRGTLTFADRHGEAGLSEVGKAFIAGILAHASELSLMYAPNANSYRRFAGDPHSPSAANWGQDNRTCAVRVVGTEGTLRVENRMPGSDANPYLAAAAMVAAGLDGTDRHLRLESAVDGDGHHTGSTPLPVTLEDALAAWTGSTWVTDTFGAEMQDHYANLARVEIEAARASASGGASDLGWERARYFEGC